MVNRVIFSFVLLFCMPSMAFALEVQARVDKNPVLLDEAMVLTITATGDVNRNALDTSALLKDFIVGNTSVSSQTRVVNFSTTKTTTWQTTLFPRKLGQFLIPALSIEDTQTAPIPIKVIPVPDAGTSETRDFFVTAELAQSNAYVQQHVTYKVKLHLAQNIERGSLQTPTIENASIEQIGEDVQYSELVNGKRFQIIERTFVIVAEKSGPLTIDSPIFSGEIVVRDSRQRFGLFGQTQNVTRRGPQLSLNVKPIPSDFTGDWLPSEYVALEEEWSNQQRFVVGEPITRTLTLTAAGLNKEQLPEIQQSYPPFIKHYPDQPTTASAQQNGIIVSQRQESTAIIPSQPGPLVIPGAEVTWFNTKTGQFETASVPARSYQVIANDTPIEKTSAPVEQNIAPIDDATTGISPSSHYSLRIWQGVSAVLAILWLITLIVLFNTRRNGDTGKPSVKPAQKNKSDVLATLYAAIDSNTTHKVLSQLLIWLKQQDNANYTSLSQALNHPSNAAINASLSQYMAGKYKAGDKQDSASKLKVDIAQKQKQAKEVSLADNNIELLFKH